MLTLYSRPRCHLCQEAASMLDRAGVAHLVQDISGDPDLEAAFGLDIPVIVDDSQRIIARGRIEPADLARLPIEAGGIAR